MIYNPYHSTYLLCMYSILCSLLYDLVDPFLIIHVVRKAAILNNLAPPPSRKRKSWGGSYNKSTLLAKPSDSDSGSLLKKTMKMAKQR